MRKILLSLLAGFAFLGLASAAPVAAGVTVTLAWNQNEESNLWGYRLYYGTASRTYDWDKMVPVPFPETQTTITGLRHGVRYFFAVTALSIEGLESDYSLEVDYAAPVPPPPPITFALADGRLSWPETAEYLETLETCTDLSAGAWEPFTGTFYLDLEARRWVALVDTSEPARFFRIRRDVRP